LTFIGSTISFSRRDLLAKRQNSQDQPNSLRNLSVLCVSAVPVSNMLYLSSTLPEIQVTSLLDSGAHHEQAKKALAKVAYRNFMSFRVDSWIVFTARVEQPIHEFTRNDTKLR
jgi:hypothetical protein